MNYYVAEVRNEEGLTKTELARKSSVSVSTISRLEKMNVSDRAVCPQTIYLLAFALNVRPSDLVTDNDRSKLFKIKELKGDDITIAQFKEMQREHEVSNELMIKLFLS